MSTCVIYATSNVQAVFSAVQQHSFRNNKSDKFIFLVVTLTYVRLRNFQTLQNNRGHLAHYDVMIWHMTAKSNQNPMRVHTEGASKLINS